MKSDDINQAFLWKKASDLEVVNLGQLLFKNDSLLHYLENLKNQKRVWTPIRGSTKRTEPTEKLEKWISEQIKHKDQVEKALGISINVNLSLEEFPIDENNTENRIISTSHNIVYLVDSCDDILQAIGQAYGNLTAEKASSLLKNDLGVLAYVTNSVTSTGRAFSGDPFTGQVAAFTRIFAYDLYRRFVRNFICYYPHQLYTQLFTKDGRIPDNKGVKMLRSQANAIITTGGVLINPNKWSILI